MRTSEAGRRTTWMAEVRDQVVALDEAISTAVELTETPTLDRVLVRLSDAANQSRLWLATAAVVALVGGPRGRRAAAESVASIGLASAVSNLALKGLAPHRPRPGSSGDDVVASRRVRRPTSSSFPSGHAASAIAFASTMGEEVPVTWLPLHAAASPRRVRPHPHRRPLPLGRRDRHDRRCPVRVDGAAGSPAPGGCRGKRSGSCRGPVSSERP